MKGDVTVIPTGQSLTSAVGAVDPDGIIQGLTGQAGTSAVGSLSPADVMGISGLEAEVNLGSTGTTSNPIIIPSTSALSSGLGSLSPADVMGLTGQSATTSVGSVTHEISLDIVLDGQSMSGNVSAFGTAKGFGIQAFQDVDTGSNTTYSDVA